MILIGERINGSFKDIARAIQEKDKEPIREWARRQAAAGADYIDVNIGAVSKRPEDMAWLVETVQEAVPTPISVDSTNVEIIKGGLAALDGRPVLINSTTAEDKKLEQLIPLVVEYGDNAGLIGVAMDERGSPQDTERRVENGAKIFAAAVEGGLTPERIFLDPILMPIKFLQPQAKNVLEAIREYTMLSDPSPHISVGLSNICSKAAKAERGLIARTFLVMAMAFGLDAAVCNVLDEDLLDAIATAELILNKEIYSDSYLRAFRMAARSGSRPN